MAGYYKRINGKNYDRRMLDMADELSGPGKKKKISLAGAKKIFSLAEDGGRITDIERRTLSYILENYNFQDAALKFLEQSGNDHSEGKTAPVKKTVKKSAPAKEQSPAHIIQEEEQVVQDYSFMKDSSNDQNNSTRNIILILLLLICLGGAFFAYIKLTDKNGNGNQTVTKTETLDKDSEKKQEVPEKKDAAALKEDVKTEKNIKEGIKPDKTEEKKGIAGQSDDTDKYYTVQPGDTLISISEKKLGTFKNWIKIYKENKGVIKKPSEIFPGQKIVIPEK